MKKKEEWCGASAAKIYTTPPLTHAMAAARRTKQTSWCLMKKALYLPFTPKAHLRAWQRANKTANTSACFPAPQGQAAGKAVSLLTPYAYNCWNV
ncbi:hypothetical protein [Desulfovibrio cuneatus]|uniref:hypothetical protein n=1 Tax=Desulfovibrio cuneatus TaxID=159728 RepID=UPI0012EBEB2F|nr:hypothetical protein [Desulfovibrio cuneatus]